MGISIQFPERHSRLTTLFRFILAIPLAIFGYGYEILALICVLITWVAMSILISGRLQGFIANYIQFTLGWITKFIGLYFLLIENY